MSGEIRGAPTPWWKEPHSQPESGLRVPPGIAEALKKHFMHGEKKNGGGRCGRPPVSQIPSSLCGPLFLRKVIGGNLR